MTKLYYIENQGCDDTTHGLVRISDEDFPKFKTFIENLNKNSTYGCMPVIHVYEIDESNIHLYDEVKEAYGCDSDKLYLDDKIYIVDPKWLWTVIDNPLF